MSWPTRETLLYQGKERQVPAAALLALIHCIVRFCHVCPQKTKAAWKKIEQALDGLAFGAPKRALAAPR